MKKLLNLLIVLVLAFGGTGLHAQTNSGTNTAIVIAPVSRTVLQPATGTLTATQVQALATALAQNGITFSGGYVANLNVRLSFKLQPSGTYIVTFYPTAPTN